MWGKKQRQRAVNLTLGLFRVHRGHWAREATRGAEDSRVIEHFRRGTEERRKSPRFAVGNNRVWLGWWTGESVFVTTAARIVNISLGGAFLSPENPPPQDRPCWLCLGVPEPVDSVELTVIEVMTTRQGQFGVRAQFREPCPYGFFKAVVDGTERVPALTPAGGGGGEVAPD